MNLNKWKHTRTYLRESVHYPALHRGADILKPPPADILGRDINELRRGLRNPEKANVVLLAEPGTGKTAYVQGFAYDKDSVDYYLVLDVNPERLIEKDMDRDNALLVGFNSLLDEAAQYSKDHNVIIVLFVDEFHKMAEISPSLMESLKPRLEKSALHGFRLIAATTFREYNQYIAPNQALDQRFLQIKLTELPKTAVISILQNRAKQHGISHLLDEGILEDIYKETKRILLSNAQPRASLDVFNSMVGDIVKTEWMEGGVLHKEYYTAKEMGFAAKQALSRPLLKRIIKRNSNIDIDNEVNVRDVIDTLKARLFNQDNAIQQVVGLLEMSAQGFCDITRPRMSFLSTGSTGTGKTELAKIISETMRLPLKRFDMSQYSDKDTAGEFADNLFHAVWATPNAYILIDEVEKSSQQAMNILLQVLDDARLADSENPDRVASFSGAIINLTTNLGSEIYQSQQKHQSEDVEADLELVYKALADSEVFNTAVLGRLDVIVPFHPLPSGAMEKIATRILHDILETAETPLRKVILSEDIIPYIVKDQTSNDTERGGARDVKRNVRNQVAHILAHYLTYADSEVPVILYLKGRPRFKYQDIADPNNAKIALYECYPITVVDSLLTKLGERLGTPLSNEGLYLPTVKPLDAYMREIAALSVQGHYKFKSRVEEEDVVIVGV